MTTVSESTLRSFAKKAIRPVLIATAIGTVPALVISALGIGASFVPRNDPEEFGPAAMIAVMLLLVFISAIATLIIAVSVAFAWYLLRQAWRNRELRLIGKRFGWTTTTQ